MQDHRPVVQDALGAHALRRGIGIDKVECDVRLVTPITFNLLADLPPQLALCARERGDRNLVGQAFQYREACRRQAVPCVLCQINAPVIFARKPLQHADGHENQQHETQVNDPELALGLRGLKHAA